MAKQNAPQDDNNRFGLIGESNVTPGESVSVYADPVTHRLFVNAAIVSGAGGVEYTEDEATPAVIVGTATMMERDDQLANVTPAEGDWLSFRGTKKGALWVAIADASGDPLTSFGGGTEYTEDVATPNPIVGSATLMERDDIITAVAPAEGDWIGFRGTAEGALWVQDFNSDAALAHLATLAGAVSAGQMQVDIVAALPTGDNNIGNVDIASSVALDVSAATVPISAAALPLPSGAATSAKQLADGHNVTIDNASIAVTGTVAVSSITTSINPGVGATNLGKAEDEPHTSGDVGVMSLAVRMDAPAAIAADGDYHPLLLGPEGALWTEHVPNEVDAGNSSTATLGIDAVFTGTGVDILSYDLVTVTIDASHDSATDGMSFQFSTDNTNWDDIYPFTYTAADGARRFQFPVTAQYFRVVYTNGGTGQTHFRMQTILHHGDSLTSIHRLVDDASPDRSAEIVKAAIIAQRGGGGPGAGDFIPVQATTAGNLKMSVQEISDGLDIGAGNAGSETQRVSIATDDVNLSGILADTAIISGAISAGQMQVDVVAALPSGDNNIGNVDVVSSALPTGAATSAKQLADGHNVTVDNGAAGAAVNIQDGGNSITVDGVFFQATQPISAAALPLPSGAATSANQATIIGHVDGIETLLGTIDADTSTIAGAVSAGQMQVDVVAALPTGSNAIGKLAANSGVDIGDVDVISILPGTAAANLGKAEDAGHTSGDVGVMALAVRNDSVAQLTNADLDYSPISVDLLGRVLIVAQGNRAHDNTDAGDPVKIGGRAQNIIGAEPEEVADNDRTDTLHDRNGRIGVTAGSDYKVADINDSTSGNNTIITAQAAGKRIAVWAWHIIADGTVDCRWEDGAAGTAFTGQLPFEAREGISASAGGLVPLFVTSAATLLNLELSAAINVHGSVSYTVIDD